MAATNYTPISLYYSSTASNIPTSGNLVNGELGLNIADMKLYAKNSAGVVTLLASNSGASATVSSVAVSGGTTGLTTSGGPITTSGTITFAGTLIAANGGTGFASYSTGDMLYASGATTISKLALGTTNYVLTAGASGPQYVAQSTLAAGSATTATNIAGGVANQIHYQTGVGATSFITAPSTAGYVLGWTGSAFSWVNAPAATSATNIAGGATGDLPYQSGAGATTFLSDVATGNALISGGVGVAPSYGKVGLTTHVSGTLPTANGGTNLTTFTSGGAVYATSTSVLTTGTLPVASGGTNATTASITSFNNITGYTATGATGTTSTNIVFSTSPTITTATLVTPNITTGLTLTGSAGTSGQALLSAGSGAAPVWGTAGITTGKAIAMAMIFGF